MGADQSTGRNGGGAFTAAEDATTRKRCYYEVLGTEQTATDEE